MMKKLLMATAASGLMLSTALAQTPPADSPPAGSPPAASQDMSKPADASKPATASTDQQVVTSQRPDQFLASKFSGTDVMGADDKKVGDVSDVLFDKDGKILAYVVSIGGFLGIGSKNVAMAPNAFQVVKGTNGESDKLKITMSQEQLKQMASFEPYQPPRPTTTGSGTGGGSRPGGGTGGGGMSR
jgi:sporulation protein YlmC with PRC-barrel domain